MQQTFTHVPQALPQQQYLQQSQLPFQQTFTQTHGPAQQKIHGKAPQQSMQPHHHMPVMSVPEQQQEAIQPH